MSDDSIRDEIKKKRKDEWIEAWFAIEALAVDEKVVRESLAGHIEKMSKLREIFIYEKDFKPTLKTKNPLKNVKEAFSQVVELKLFAKNLPILVSTVILYGPSAIEILGPDNKKTSIEEMQNVTNIIAGIVHQFAAAGVGGIVLTPPD